MKELRDVVTNALDQQARYPYAPLARTVRIEVLEAFDAAEQRVAALEAKAATLDATVRDLANRLAWIGMGR